MLIYQQKRLNENEKKLVMHWLKFEKLKGLFNLWKVVLNIKKFGFRNNEKLYQLVN
jgi:hypothetical protein